MQFQNFSTFIEFIPSIVVPLKASRPLVNCKLYEYLRSLIILLISGNHKTVSPLLCLKSIWLCLNRKQKKWPDIYVLCVLWLLQGPAARPSPAAQVWKVLRRERPMMKMRLSFPVLTTLQKGRQESTKQKRDATKVRATSLSDRPERWVEWPPQEVELERLEYICDQGQFRIRDNSSVCCCC